jgi:beta-glucosidase
MTFDAHARTFPGVLSGEEVFRDAGRSVAERVEDLLSRMTLSEKLGQMMLLDARQDLADAILDKQAGAILHASPTRIHQAHELVGRTRLRIPLLVAEDCIHGHSFWPGATIFPVQLALAATFDPLLVQDVARVTAVEAAATGIHWVFSPTLCIARDPRWGRVNETFGEDPHLIAELGAAMIRGYQGDGLSDRDAVLACAKHFAGYSETQGGRDASEADISRRKLRAWFLPPFERAVREGCRTFMTGYQAIDGVPVTANTWLLRDVLRDEWGFGGAVVTDWDNVGRMVWEQQTCADITDAATVAVRAGNDVAMTTPTFAAGAQTAVHRGLLAQDQLDDAVRNILRLKFELGLFDDPRLPSPQRRRQIGTEANTALNLQAARRSLVLLSNNGTLPLDHRAARLRVAVIGPNADNAQGQLGDWAGSSGQVDWMPQGHPRAAIHTVLDGLRAVAPTGWEIGYARGADIIEPVAETEGMLLPDGQPAPTLAVPAAADPALIDEAVLLAKAADHAVVVVGDDILLTGEGRSTATLELLGAQVALLDAVASTGTPTTVVVISGKPLVLPESALDADALIQAFSPGMQGGRAIAELLLGHIEPSGRLPISIPRHAGQLPVFYNTVRGQHADRYADLTQEPQFVFGEGLSYTEITYSDLTILTPEVTPDGVVRATVRLTNTGSRPALETVQVYVRDIVTSATWADRELKAYQQVPLEPGSTHEVTLSVPAGACSIVTADGRRTVEPGAFELLVGKSARLADLLMAPFTIS